MKLILQFVTVLSCFNATYGINGGEIADKKDFKYVVGIEIIKSSPSASSSCKRCTGGIIHEKFIITAAHCFAQGNKDTGYEFQSRKVTVYGNDDNLYEPSSVAVQRSGKTVYFISTFFENGYNDIALLELKDGLHLDNENKDVLEKLTIPPLAQSTDSKVGLYNSYGGYKCLIAGFGYDLKLENNDGKLKKMHSQIILCSGKTCPVNTSYLKYKFLLAKAMNADGHPPINPLGICNGDSGAPVVLVTSPSTIIGVVARSSIGKKCDSRSETNPELYVRISRFIDFINNVILSRTNQSKYVTHDIN